MRFSSPRATMRREAHCELPQLLAGLHAVGARELRGRGRRRRAHVGDEIGDREIGLVARRPTRPESGTPRSRARAPRRCRPTGPRCCRRRGTRSARRTRRASLGGAHRVRDPRARAFALHRRGIDDHGQPRHAAPERRQHVAQRGGLRRGDDAEHARKARQRRACAPDRKALRARASPSAARTLRRARRAPRGASTSTFSWNLPRAS